jgi:hypothetical protein
VWRSRRLGDYLVRRYGRRLLKAAGVLVVVMIATIPLVISYVASHVARGDVPTATSAPPTRT